MTEEIGSDRHRNPSSAEIDIVKLRERHSALKDNVDDMSATMMDIKSLLLTHINSSGERHSQLLATFNQHNLEDTIVHQRVIGMREEMDALKEESKRDPVTFWTSIAAAGTAVGAVLTAIFGGGKP